MAAALLALAAVALFSSRAAAYNFDSPYGDDPHSGPDVPYYDVSAPNNTVNPAAKRVCAINDALSSEENMIRYGLTKRIVMCVKDSIIAAVYYVLVPFSDFFGKTIAIMCTVALVVWGVQMATGRRSASTRDAFLLALKIGLVIMFTSSMHGGFAANLFDPRGDHGGLFGMILDAMSEMLRIVVNYVTVESSFAKTCPPLIEPPLPDSPLVVLSVWDTVDCALDTLVGGIFSPISLGAGIVGFLTAALLSGVMGMFIALLGFMLILTLLMAIIRAMYIFISAYIAFALMVLVSPMFIPLVLFASTKAYFEKWLRLTIGFILQPIFIFAYLAMMMAAYDTIVYTGERSLYRSLIGDHIDGELYAGVGGVGAWLDGISAYYEIKRGEASANIVYSDRAPVCDDTDCETKQVTAAHETGTLAVIGEQLVTSAKAWRNKNIYSVLGDENIFKTSIPLTAVDWQWIAAVSYAYNPLEPTIWNMLPLEAKWAYDDCQDDPLGSMCPDPYGFINNYYKPYIIGLFLSIIMAAITTYIFMFMLEYLPFIGSGISGESLSMPTFGVGSMAPPGSGMVGNIRDKLGNNFLGRK